MVENGLMSLDPFSQLSLDPFSTRGDTVPGTPPPVPKSENITMTSSDVPGMNQYSNQQQQQQQQQPMHITPEQASNPAGAIIQHQGQQQQPAAYSNYQYNVFGEFPPQMQQPHVQQQMMPPQAQRQSLTSPPISPLWAPSSPDQSPTNGAPVNMQQQFANNGMNMPSMPTGMPVPTLSPSSPVPVANPFDMFAATTPTAPVAAAPADPFAGNNAAVPPAQQQQVQEGTQGNEADFWNDMGFGTAAPSSGQDRNITPTSSTDGSFSSVTSEDNSNSYNQDHSLDDTPVALDERGLPAGGQYYNARVTTSMLGAIFSSGKELRSTLFKTASNSFVESIGDRPVISFTIDGSAADTAGIGLGHILLNVNGEEVTHTDDAVTTVGAAARPMTMEFYIPNKDVKVVKTEGQCMVKYDNHSTEAPASACEWKPKYVVVGDMLGKSHILYMYRSKAEYDIAVRESQTRSRTLSVKVKQFDIRGARIFHEQGTVRYPSKPLWNYFTIVRGQGVPIKISASSPEGLQPVYDGVVAFLANEVKMKKIRMEERRERMSMVGINTETYY